MKKIKEWFVNHFLPLWAKETVLADNRNLKRIITEQDQEIRELKAHINGMNAGLRSMRRITINAGTKEDKRE